MPDPGHLSPEAIDSLTEEVHHYIMWLETNADPAGTLQENHRLTMDNATLQSKVTALQKELAKRPNYNELP